MQLGKADLIWLATMGAISLVALFALGFVVRPLALRLATNLPGPAAALADVITETNAYWTIETSHGPYDLADYREIAADMWDHGREMVASSVAHHIAAARKVVQRAERRR